MTRYKIRVDDLLADDFAAVDPKADGFREKFSEGRVGLKKGSTVDVILPGGKISFPGGATAQIDVMNVQRMESGHSYLLYLHYSAQLRGFVVTGLSRGMFEIADDGESLHWMAVTKTDKGFRLESKTFESSVSNARTEAKMNKDAHR